MRKYYLFAIKKDVYKSYYNYPEVLYQTINNLYNIKHNNISYGISIYEQICDTFNVGILIRYFSKRSGFHIKKKNKKIYVNNLYTKEKYLIEIRNSCLIVACQNNLPKVMKLLEYYNPRIFVIDFESFDYFWNDNNCCHNNNLYEYNVI